MSEDSLFEKLGLEVGAGKVEVGSTYPLFGCITQIIEEEDSNPVCVLNESIKLHMKPGQELLDTVKDRLFESGIFISEITHVSDEEIVANCLTVIYGRKQKLGTA